MKTVEQQTSSEQVNAALPWHSGVRVVQSHSSVLAVYKPCGVRSHPNHPCGNSACQSLLEVPYDFEKEAYKVGEKYIYLLNRLDSPTSGLMLLSTDFETAQEVRALFKAHRVQKIYHAIVKGFFPEKPLVWRDCLDVQHKVAYVRTRRTKDRGMWAKTKVRLLKIIRLRNEILSLIELQPLTGRTHQLRVQCATRGFPILGDKTYGDFGWNKRLKAERLYLHAGKVFFSFGSITFEAEYPSGWGFENARSNAVCDKCKNKSQ